jgi:hypothetical protein
MIKEVSREAGSTLLLVLVLILICSLIVVRGVESLRSRLMQMTSSVLMEKSLSKVYPEAFNFLRHLPFVPGMHCPAFSSEARWPVSRKICVFQPINKEQLLIDYNLMFSAAVACKEEDPLQSLATSGSFVSSQACFLDAINQQEQSFLGNLFSKNPITFPLKEHEVTRVAATGLISFKHTLEFSSDLLIVAGGDLFIEKLNALLDSRVTLVSASGKVMVNQISGPVSLKVISAADVILPPHTSQHEVELLPPALEWYLVGMFRE